MHKLNHRPGYVLVLFSNYLLRLFSRSIGDPSTAYYPQIKRDDIIHPPAARSPHTSLEAQSSLAILSGVREGDLFSGRDTLPLLLPTLPHHPITGVASIFFFSIGA